MKKLILRILANIVIFTAASNTWAESMTCPAAEMIKSTIFTRAIEYKAGLWVLTSDAFSSDSKDWNVGALVPVKDTKSPAEALTKGQAYFNQAGISEMQPTPVHYGRITTCKYTSDSSLDYQVYALNPPQYGMSTMSIMK